MINYFKVSVLYNVDVMLGVISVSLILSYKFTKHFNVLSHKLTKHFNVLSYKFTKHFKLRRCEIRGTR